MSNKICHRVTLASVMRLICHHEHTNYSHTLVMRIDSVHIKTDFPIRFFKKQGCRITHVASLINNDVYKLHECCLAIQQACTRVSI